MPLDYETPPPPSVPPSARRRRIRRAIAMALLVTGLFFALAETVVFVLGMLAVGPFDDMRRMRPSERIEEMNFVIVIALAGYGLAAGGYFLDPKRAGRRTDAAER